MSLERLINSNKGTLSVIGFICLASSCPQRNMKRGLTHTMRLFLSQSSETCLNISPTCCLVIFTMYCTVRPLQLYTMRVLMTTGCTHTHTVLYLLLINDFSFSYQLTPPDLDNLLARLHYRSLLSYSQSTIIIT